MKPAEEFLASIARRRVANAAISASLPHNRPDVTLPPELMQAADNCWQICPVLAHSNYFSRQALVGGPTSDPAQICQWAQEYRGYSWAVATGAGSALLILEVDVVIGRTALKFLCGDDWTWRNTLQFQDRDTRFVCFRYSGQKVRALGSGFAGLLIHSIDFVLIPPSVYAYGVALSYLDPDARVLDAPEWLLAAPRDSVDTLRCDDTVAA